MAGEPPSTPSGRRPRACGAAGARDSAPPSCATPAPSGDVHRHRLSPEVAERLNRMRADGRLRVLAGKLERADILEGGRAGLVWRTRGETDTSRLEADLVDTCTGPSTDVERSTEPLIAALAARGLIRADPMRLGLDVDARHRVVHADGRPHPTLFAVGPITRGAPVGDQRRPSTSASRRRRWRGGAHSSSAAWWMSSDSLAIDGCGAEPTPADIGDLRHRRQARLDRRGARPEQGGAAGDAQAGLHRRVKGRKAGRLQGYPDTARPSRSSAARAASRNRQGRLQDGHRQHLRLRPGPSSP